MGVQIIITIDMLMGSGDTMMNCCYDNCIKTQYFHMFTLQPEAYSMIGVVPFTPATIIIEPDSARTYFF